MSNYVGWYKTCCICKIEKPIEEFSWKNNKEGTYSKECKKCHKEIRDRYYINNCEKEKAGTAKRKKEIKDWFKNYKQSLKCNRCPEDHISTLDFHHRDSSKKDISISVAISNGWSIKRILKEIEKCEVLCANCHRKEHYAGVA